MFWHKKKKEPVEIKKQEIKPLPVLTYSRYENIIIDDKFIYDNEELTGDLYYDIYTIYNIDDGHNSKKYLSEPSEENILRIKNNHDIKLIKTKKGYEISNGRHRLLYLKSLYQLTKLIKENNNQEFDNNNFKVTLLVEYKLEDERINHILDKLKSIFPGMKAYKVNPYDDNPVIFIYINRTTYLIHNYEELVDFISNMEKYKYLTRTKKDDTDYDELIISMYKILGTKLYELSILDVINYLELNNMIDKDQININKLYYSFRLLLDGVHQKILRGQSILDLNLDFILFSKKYRLGSELMLIINNKIDDINSSNLISILRNYPQYDEYTDSYLLESLNTNSDFKSLKLK